MKKAKLWLFGLLSSLFLFLSFSQALFIRKANADLLENILDPTKWIMCDVFGKEGKDILKMARTDVIPYYFTSKSNLGTIDTPEFNLHNGILRVSGYEIGEKNAKEVANPFEKFGLGGLVFSSYRGEWKYYNVDPCNPKSGGDSANQSGEGSDSAGAICYPPEQPGSDKIVIPGMLHPDPNTTVTSRFGPRFGFGDPNNFHAAVDIAGPPGNRQEMKAPWDGEVECEGNPFGLIVVLKHGDIGEYKDVKTVYLHNSKNLVKKGDKVKRGDVIALQGSTGNSTGEHIHFELVANGKKVDPEPSLNEAEGSKTKGGGENGSSSSSSSKKGGGGKSNDYGIFYDKRLEPLSTYGEIHATVDVRTKEFARGSWTAYGKALANNFNNILLWLVKLVLAFVLALMSLALSDISTLVGLGSEFQESFVTQMFTGVFLPFLLFFVLLSAVYIFYVGIIKREYRQALIQGLVKMLAAIFIAFLISYNPSLVSIPNKLATAGQALVVSLISGNIQGDSKEMDQKIELCATELKKSEVTTDPNSLIDADVKSSNILKKQTDELDKYADYMRAVLGCRMWSEFVFKPFVKAQFGDEFKNLSDLKNVNSKWTGDYTVQLSEKNKIKNLGLFHVSVFSGYHQGLDGKVAPLVNGVHRDYYRIVDILANYDEGLFKGASVMDEGGGGGGGMASNVKKFLDEYGEIAKQIAEESGMYASVLLAQAGLESGWGASPSGDHNFFGIKCFNGPGGCKTLATTEVYGGQSVGIMDGFQNFPSKEEGLKGYAKFIWGCGAGADFKGGLKKNAGSPLEAITNIHKAGYATDPGYVGKIMQLIRENDLTKYDTDSKEPTKPEEYEPCAKGGKNGGGGGGGSSDSPIGDVPIPLNNPVLPQWDAWIGNQQLMRTTNTLFMLVFVIIGSILPLVFGLSAAMYGVAITVLSILAPVFLLFGVWAGKGNQILTQYFGSLLSTILKKIVLTFLLVLSIILSTAIMDLINSVGVVTAMIYFIIIIIVMYKNKDSLVAQMSQINMGQLNLEGAYQGIDVAKNMTKQISKVTALAVITGAKTLSNGGNLKTAAKSSAKQAKATIADQLYKTSTGRQALRAGHLAKKKQEGSAARCHGCKGSLNGRYYEKENGVLLCNLCAGAEGYEGMSERHSDNLPNSAKSLKNSQMSKHSTDKDGSNILNDGKKSKLNGKETRRILAEKGKLNEHHLSVDEIVEDFHLADDDVKWENIDQDRLHQRMRDSMSIVTNDLYKVKNSSGKLQDYFIPTPLRPYIPASLMAAIVKKNDISAYHKAIAAGWEEWYRTTALSKGATTEEIEAQLLLMKEDWANDKNTKLNDKK